MKRNGFTLVELLVVVAIMGILMGLLLPRLSRAIASAREQTCRANLRNLQAACISYANDNGKDGGESRLPRAGSWETYDNVNGVWHERKGWISWIGNGSWPNNTPQKGSMMSGGFRGTKAADAIRYGNLWEYTNRDIKTYRCPVAAKSPLFRGGSKSDGDVNLSYEMSSFFNHGLAANGMGPWDGRRVLSWIGVREYSSDKGSPPVANRIMLFCESTGHTGSSDNDVQSWNKNAVIHVPTSQKDNVQPDNNGAYQMGAYHLGPSKSGGKWGLAIFLDGHIEKLAPSTVDDAGRAEDAALNRAFYLVRGLEVPLK